jgi:hypothetical protein
VVILVPPVDARFSDITVLIGIYVQFHFFDISIVLQCDTVTLDYQKIWLCHLLVK